MNDKSTCDKFHKDVCNTSPIQRKKKATDVNQDAKGSSLLAILLWGCFRSGARKNKFKVKDKYESVLYLQPKEDSKEDVLPARKQDFNNALSNGINRSSHEKLDNVQNR